MKTMTVTWGEYDEMIEAAKEIAYCESIRIGRDLTPDEVIDVNKQVFDTFNERKNAK